MKSLYATLYFSSIVIPGALQAPGMCHLRGRALSLCQGERDRLPAACVPRGLPLRPTAPGELWGAAMTFLKLQTLHILLLCPLLSRHSEGPQMNSGLGQFPYKETKLLKEEYDPASAPANGPQRLFLHTGIWEAGFEEEIFVIIM